MAIDMKLSIYTPAGNTHVVTVPHDMLVDDFLEEILSALDLPIADAVGDPISWNLFDRDTGRHLDPDSSLGANGVGEGHRLYLEQLVIAGGPPDDRVLFSVYHPARLRKSSRLLAYAHVMDALDAIENDAQARLKGVRQEFASVRSPATTNIKRGAKITIVPSVPGCRFVPQNATVKWVEPWQCAEFEIERVNDASRNREASGSIMFFVGPVLVACIQIRVNFIRIGLSRPKISTERAMPYQNVFVSYAHEDTPIVDALEQAYSVLGMRYLRDVRDLRSGEIWSESLLSMIERAEVFQLCWSHSAKASKYVDQEWRHALKQEKEKFIRPVFWEQPMPTAPAELQKIHFAFLNLNALARNE